MAYVAVLKGKPGEFAAWRRASSAVVKGCRPLFEVVPTRGEDQDLSTFVNGVAVRWPPNAVLTVDTGYLDQSEPIAGTPHQAVLWTARSLHQRGIPAIPVMRPDDEPDVLAEVASAIALHGQGACLRLGSEESDPDPDYADAWVPDALDAANVIPGDVDLVIDLWAVASAREVGRALPVATAMLAWADATGPWRNVAVVSGAFPASISNLPTGTASPIPRFDAELFDQIVASNAPLEPDYGDYGVAHPAMPTPVPRGPLPNLRYTASRECLVYREQRTLPGNQSFFTLCTAVVASGHWPGPSYSWGDSEIARCAASQGGAGTATQWRAYGTSHHLEHIIDRLANHGAP